MSKERSARRQRGTFGDNLIGSKSDQDYRRTVERLDLKALQDSRSHTSVLRSTRSTFYSLRPLLRGEFLLSSAAMVLPARSRNRAAIFVTIAVIALLVGAALPYTGKGFTPRFIFLMGGLVGIVFGGVWLFICWDAARRYARLKAGQGVIARWTIDPAHWERFRQQSKVWDKIKGVQPNSANLDQTPGASGIEIVVTGDSVLVGEEFYPFEDNVRIQGPTERMEFHYTLYRRYGPQWQIAMRIPLAPGAQHHRARIVEVYSQAKATAAANRPNKIFVFLIIVVGFAALTGLVVSVMHLLRIGP